MVRPADRLVRVEVVDEMCSRLAARLVGVHVDAAPSPRGPEEQLFVARVAGESAEVPTMRAGRKAREDRFSMEWVAQTRPYPSALDAMARAQQLVQAVDDMLAEAPSLDELPGVAWAMIVAMDGPEAYASERGWTSEMRCRVVVVTRLHGSG